VAEVRKVGDITGGKSSSSLERRIHGAIAFAVPAGIADMDLTFGLGNDLIQVQFVPPSSSNAGQTGI